MTVVDTVWQLIEPEMQGRGLEVVDVEHGRGLLRIYLDRDGGGIDLEAITEASEIISRLLDEHDPVPGSYTLEVSSPGLERPLTTAAHFARAVGTKVTLRSRSTGRVQGVLVAATDDTIEVAPDDGEPLHIAIAEVERARTVFEWGPPPKPGKAPKKKKAPTP